MLYTPIKVFLLCFLCGQIERFIKYLVISFSFFVMLSPSMEFSDSNGKFVYGGSRRRNCIRACSITDVFQPWNLLTTRDRLSLNLSLDNELREVVPFVSYRDPKLLTFLSLMVFSNSLSVPILRRTFSLVVRIVLRIFRILR